MRTSMCFFLVGLSLASVALVRPPVAAQAQRKPGRQARPQFPPPPVVHPDGSDQAPADAVLLFDGRDLSGWTRPDGSPTGCVAADGAMVCNSGVGDAISVETFRDAQIHLEFNVPHMPDQTGQVRGNSGVFLQGCYEIQILDSWQNPTYPDGSCGALYGIAPPLVNASRRPGEWQSFDIVFRAPRCSAPGVVAEPGRVTAFHNGVLIHDHVAIGAPGPGCGGCCGNRNICRPGPLVLQDHSGFPDAPKTEMRFRNIWLRRLP